ncbi:PfkB family carbohydrate kinase [Pseudonocardia sp.]|uniref:PfkB family carbohydrate kinase n=1 Tax=Pseudonocardia sp. TaxID=60912 RepID=UPI0031FDACA5
MTAYDVIVLGEPLVEVATADPFGHGVPATLGVSGDVVNSAAAAAAAGARVAIVARVATGELGDAVVARIRALGVDDALVRRVRGQQGVYLLHSDPSGQRQFSYARAGSVGAALSPADLDADTLAAAGAVLASGITAALSVSAHGAVLAAAKLGRRFVYDPNFRPRLTSSAAAAAVLAEVAPLATLLTPSAPGETGALLGTGDPATAATILRGLGARAVAVTCGDRGVHVSPSAGGPERWHPAVPAPSVVDQTGAGDVFTGTVTARLALGDDLQDAVRLGAAAASLAVGGQGGTGFIAGLEQVRAHAGAA